MIPLDAPILVDLDGTLVDTLADIAASLNHVRARLELPPATLPAVRDMIGDGARTLLDRGLERTTGAGPAATKVEQLNWFVEHHHRQCTVHATVYPGVGATLAAWRAEGRKVAVVTNKPEALALRLLDHLGMSPLFDAVVGGDTTPERKPNAEPLLEAIRRLGTAPSVRPWMIGDGIPDMRAGHAAGAVTLAVTYGYRDPHHLAAERPNHWWQQFGGPMLDSAPPTGDPLHP